MKLSFYTVFVVFVWSLGCLYDQVWFSCGFNRDLELQFMVMLGLWQRSQ